MSALLKRLGPKAQRGSKPRCHWLTHGTNAQVAARLSALAAPWATVTATDRWMPGGFEDLEEARLHKRSPLLDYAISKELAAWWLPAGRQEARTPNFDIASTCTIDGTAGILLIEAKAHDEELKKEAVGKRHDVGASAASKTSHESIGKAIMEAQQGLSDATAVTWHISRDCHYQMSNRFAWSWKLAQCGIPVVLVYLGFLNADEMADQGMAFDDHGTWEALVRAHSAPLFPSTIWSQRWSVHHTPLIPLIRSLDQPLDPESGP